MDALSLSAFRAMIAFGSVELENHCAEVNDLNVFPVPDGDTGSNMSATMSGGVSAINAGKDPDFASLGRAMSEGMLLSARGNSGVILSQFFAGFAKALPAKDTLSIQDFLSCMGAGVRNAYAVVRVPVEGTMLTVMREGHEKAMASSPFKDFESLFIVLLKAMEASLEHTPEKLSVLADAGVVDSGGAGFLYIFRGMAASLDGKSLSYSSSSTAKGSNPIDLSLFNEDSHLDYGYCTEFLLQLTKEKGDPSKFPLQEFIDFLSTVGDSIVCFQNGTIVKVHVHTKTPDKAIEYARRYGDFLTFKMENMALQHNEVLARREEKAHHKKGHTPIAAIAVSPTEEISSIFRGYGVEVILPSNEFMNPGADDFLRAFDMADADAIFVFPNNKNEIMVAHQAATLYKKSWIYVIETLDLPMGLAAASVMDIADLSVKENLRRMDAELSKAHSIALCVAIHDSKNNGLVIKEGDYMGLLDDDIIVAAPTMEECFEALLKKVEGFEDMSVITLVHGKGVKEEKIEKLREIAVGLNDFIEVYPVYGNQTLYPILGVLE